MPLYEKIEEIGDNVSTRPKNLQSTNKDKAEIFFPFSNTSVMRIIMEWNLLESPSGATSLNTMFSIVSLVDLYLKISLVLSPVPLLDKSRRNNFLWVCAIENKVPGRDDMMRILDLITNSSFDSMFTITFWRRPSPALMSFTDRPKRYAVDLLGVKIRLTKKSRGDSVIGDNKSVSGEEEKRKCVIKRLSLIQPCNATTGATCIG